MGALYGLRDVCVLLLALGKALFICMILSTCVRLQTNRPHSTQSDRLAMLLHSDIRCQANNQKNKGIPMRKIFARLTLCEPHF
jgi:hypothetical protein